MVLQRAPVELWQTILRYSISVPVFLEANPLDRCGFRATTRCFHEESAYWTAERHRNILRRVCSNWNLYLRQFNHRFVRSEDIEAGHVPVFAIRQAIRINFATFGSSLRGSIGELTSSDQAGNEIREIWRLEILHCEDLDVVEFLSEVGEIPNLRCIFDADIDFEGIAAWVPTLQFVDGLPKKFRSKSFLRFSELTTLCVLMGSTSDLLGCSFPSLKHFSIYYGQDVDVKPQDLIALLGVTGKNLVTFLDNSTLLDQFLPDEVWSLCPKVQMFQTGFMWPSNTKTPSSLKSIRIATRLLIEASPYVSSYFPIAAFREAGITSIAFLHSWKSALGYWQYTLDYVIHAMDHGIDFYDGGGIRFQDLIINAILYRKGHRIKFLREWNRTYYEF